MVPEAGLEPARPHRHLILSQARLPIPSLGRISHSKGRTLPFSAESLGIYFIYRQNKFQHKRRKFVAHLKLDTNSAPFLIFPLD